MPEKSVYQLICMKAYLYPWVLPICAKILGEGAGPKSHLWFSFRPSIFYKQNIREIYRKSGKLQLFVFWSSWIKSHFFTCFRHYLEGQGFKLWKSAYTSVNNGVMIKMHCTIVISAIIWPNVGGINREFWTTPVPYTMWIF